MNKQPEVIGTENRLVAAREEKLGLGQKCEGGQKVQFS